MNGLTDEQLKKVVRSYICNRYDSVRDTLLEINDLFKNRFTSLILCPQNHFFFYKKELSEIGLWDEKFDDYYHQAINGKLTQAEVGCITN